MCRKKTIEKIEKKLENVEVLKIKLNEEELFVINVLTIIDCLDKEKSDIEYLSKGIIFKIKKYSFKKEMLQKINIFKILEQCTATIFVSEEFKNIIEENKITGVEFKKLWDSEKEDEPEKPIEYWNFPEKDETISEIQCRENYFATIVVSENTNKLVKWLKTQNKIKNIQELNKMCNKCKNNKC